MNNLLINATSIKVNPHDTDNGLRYEIVATIATNINGSVVNGEFVITLNARQLIDLATARGKINSLPKSVFIQAEIDMNDTQLPSVYVQRTEKDGIVTVTQYSTGTRQGFYEVNHKPEGHNLYGKCIAIPRR